MGQRSNPASTTIQCVHMIQSECSPADSRDLSLKVLVLLSLCQSFDQERSCYEQSADATNDAR